MSWALTIDDLQNTEVADSTFENMAVDNPAYLDDARSAYDLAKQRGLVSATISGARTPSPYNGPDTVVITVHGFDTNATGHAVSHDDQVRANIGAGPFWEPEDDLLPANWDE